MVGNEGLRGNTAMAVEAGAVDQSLNPSLSVGDDLLGRWCDTGSSPFAVWMDPLYLPRRFFSQEGDRLS